MFLTPEGNSASFTIDALIQHRCLIMSIKLILYVYTYVCTYSSDHENCILLSPPIQSRHQSIYS